MTFPSTGTLDDFNRSAEGPPMVGWADIVSGLKIISSEVCVGHTAGLNNFSYYNHLFSSANQEVYVRLGDINITPSYYGIGVRLHVSPHNGYWLIGSPGNNSFSFYKVTNGVFANLGSVSQVITFPSWLWLKANGGSFEAFYANDPLGVGVTGLSFTRIGQWFDNTYAEAGYIGAAADGTFDSGSGAYAVEIGPFGGGVFPGDMSSINAVCAIPNLPDPLLRVVSADGKIIDLLGEGGWKISDPYWRPQKARYKNDGHYVDSAMADDTRLVFKKYAPAVETIPLSVRGKDQVASIRTIRELLQLGRQSSDYWTESYEFDNVWLECRPAHPNCRTGYARIKKMQVPELSDPFGQPFFSYYPESVMEDISLVIEREPLWRGVAPGDLIGPLYNLIKNPDFELWNFGVTDSQPDSWQDLETIQITGSNNREDSTFHSGNYSLRVRVGGSTLTGRMKGISQTISGTRANTTYTVLVWVRNDGVGNGVGRVLVTYSSQLEVYRESAKHDWTLFTGTFTTGAADVVAINCEILTTSAGTDGTVYFDSLMLLEGNWEEEAIANMLPFMTSSHIVNHWDQPTNNVVEAGDINYVDMWNVPGDESALVRLEFQNNTTPSDFSDPVELLATVRIGMRRTKDVQNFQNYQDFLGIADTTASSNDRLETINLNNSWLEVGIKNIEGVGNTLDNQGRFRVLARVYDPQSSGTSTLQARLSYYVGVAAINQKTLDAGIAGTRQNWTIIDLTPNAAMIWDQKFSPSPPTQLGYSVQMKRNTGSDKGRLDYVLALPTDGGFIKANINPSLRQGDALVVDNTAPALMVAAVQKAQQWVKIYTTDAGSFIPDIITDGIFLYVNEDRSGGSTSRIHKLKPGQSAQVFDLLTANSIFAMAIFNGDFFYANGGLILQSDGNVFPGSQILNINAGGNVVASDMKAFAGKLYISGTRIVPAPFQTTLWTWDGTSGVQIGSFLTTSLSDDKYLGAYRGHVFLSIGDGTVREYDPVSGTFTSHTPVAGSQLVTNFEVFQDKLYTMISVGGIGTVYSYDGSTWQASNLSVSIAGTRKLLAFDNRLYAQSDNATYVSTDGNTFGQITSFTPELDTGYNGTLVGDNNEDVYILAPENTPDKTYAIPDFQGVLFAAPPRTKTEEKRHRYVFSYDREGFINEQDDAALIGIGIVPLYLTLVGEN